MKNYLFYPRAVRKSSGRKDFLVFQSNIYLGIMPEEIFANEREVFVSSANKRIRLDKSGRVFHYPNAPGDPPLTKTSYFKGFFVGKERKELVFSADHLFCHLPHYRKGDVSLQLTKKAVILFDRKKKELLSFPVKEAYLAGGKSSWTRERKDINTFLPGSEYALFAQGNRGEVTSISLLDAHARIQSMPGYLADNALHTKGGDDIYLALGKSLQRIRFSSGTHEEIALFSKAIKDITASGSYLALLFSDHLEVRKNGKIILKKESMSHIKRIALVGDRLFLFSKKEGMVKIYRINQ